MSEEKVVQCGPVDSRVERMEDEERESEGSGFLVWGDVGPLRVWPKTKRMFRL